VVCPIVDLFDQWDHAFLTGNDSEYPLVVLALCVGLAFMLARLAIRISAHLPVSGRTSATASACNPFSSLKQPAAVVFVPGSSPPALPLRI
jgi:hypothetical protein